MGGRLAGALVGALACAACIALAIAWAVRPLAHDDLFGHLRTGEWIAAHHLVPRTDLFSFTRFGAPWVTHEWGFSLIAFAVDSAAGRAGLKALTALLTLAIGAAVALRARAMAAGRRPLSRPRQIGPALQAVLLPALLGLGLWAVSSELFLRAALAGELLLALLLLALDRHAASGRPGFLVAVVLLFLVWGNLHSSVLFGLALLALFTLEAVLAPVLAPRLPRLASLFPGQSAASGAGGAAPYLVTLAASLAASLANPNGAAALLYPVRLGHLLFASGIDWDLGHFAAASPTADSALLLLVVLLLAGLLPGTQHRLLSLGEVLRIALFFLLALRTHRFVFGLMVVALPTVYKLLSCRMEEAHQAGATTGAPIGAPIGSMRARAPAAGALAAAAITLLLAAAAAGAWAALSPRAIAEHFPAAAARFLTAQGIRGRIFNHQNHGGFLSWRLRVPIFWDGRNDVFASLVREVTTTPFAEVAARYGVDHLLLTEREYDDLRPELAAGRWGLVYWDDFCAIYLRRAPRFAPLLGRLELGAFPPFGGRPGLAAVAADPPAAAAVRRELARVLAANPETQRALYFSGILSLYQGDPRRAERELRAALSVRPNEQVALALARLHAAAAR